MKLSSLAHGRDNNFNLIRIVAALAVLISHSFTLALGPGDYEPIRQILGMTLGVIGVDLFFTTSGFLVTASLLTRQNAIDFTWARALRIFPGLVVMLVLTVFVLGVVFTALPLPSYFSDSATYFYLVKCATLITGVDYALPGVFEGNPFKSVVNGSLWTMPYEIGMYAVLAIIWIAFRKIARSRVAPFNCAIITIAVVAGFLAVTRHFYLPARDDLASFSFMFFSGASFYILKESITISHWAFCLSVVAMLFSAMINQHAFFLVYTLTIAYVLFYVAYVPSGRVRNYNRVGDYSYGVYIYAFPVQQSVAALVPGISVLALLLISASATLLLGALSWHLIERRSLGLKGLYVDHTVRLADASTRTR
jgi:peptidoglycan/LPS O-acetylase OafA/YrhL